MFKKPQSYRDLVYPDRATFDLVDSLVTGHHPFPDTGKCGLVIYGPYGTGKTTLANLLPNEFELQRGNPEGVTPLRLSIQTSGNGPAVIKNIEKATSLVPWGTQHYVILDEVDNLGASSMSSLKGVMNVPGTVFFMTTNYLEDIDPGVLSRSYLIPMTPPPPAQWLPVCLTALSNAGVTQNVSQAALTNVVASCNGDVRELAAQLRIIANRLKAAAPISQPPPITTP